MEKNSEGCDAQGTDRLAREILEELRHLGKAVRPHVQNMTRGEIAVLHMLRTEGAPLTPTQIAERSGVSSARVANILRALEAKGWVLREHSSVDRRRVTVTLTEAGLAALKERYGVIIGKATAFLDELGEDDARDMLRLLRRTNEVFGDRRGDLRPETGEGAAR